MPAVTYIAPLPHKHVRSNNHTGSSIEADLDLTSAIDSVSSTTIHTVARPTNTTTTAATIVGNIYDTLMLPLAIAGYITPSPRQQLYRKVTTIPLLSMSTSTIDTTSIAPAAIPVSTTPTITHSSPPSAGRSVDCLSITRRSPTSVIATLTVPFDSSQSTYNDDHVMINNLPSSTCSFSSQDTTATLTTTPIATAAGKESAVQENLSWLFVLVHGKRHRWARWSIVASLLITTTVYIYSVYTSLAVNTSSGTTVRSHTSHIQTVSRQDSLSLSSAESATILVKKANMHLPHWKLMKAKNYDPQHTQHAHTSCVHLPPNLSHRHMYDHDSSIITTLNLPPSQQPPLIFTTVDGGGEEPSSVRNKMIFVEGVKTGVYTVLHLLGEILIHQYDAYM